ncbi:MAG: ABC transporter permease [Acidimicrobiales bacterium]
MFGITLSDLVYRRRQFLIATAGAGLVFAMTLLLAGLAAGFSVEIDQSVSGFHTAAWVVKANTPNRIVSLTPLPERTARQVAALPGVTRATPVIIVPQTAQANGSAHAINLIGAPPGSPPSLQPLTSGRQVAGTGQAVVDDRLRVAVGDLLQVSGHPIRVVGVTTDRSLLGGIPDVYVTIADAQVAAFGGQPIINAVVVNGVPSAVPSSLSVQSNQVIEQASLDQMAQAVSSINNSKWLMWIIAAVIVASLVYVTALERTRDFAVLKALGASSGTLFFGLAIQAVAVALAAAAIAAVLAQFATGVFAQPVDVPVSAYIELPISAVIVGLLASLIALRRAVSVDPAMAFAG